MRHTSTLSLSFAAAAGILLLSGCSLLTIGPARDANGRVSEPAEINSSNLLDGDCFSFIDGTNLAKSTVVPCAQEHALVVIGTGELDDAAVTSAGGLQNAVSAACDEPFDTFKASAPKGAKPELQFIVSTDERDGAEFTKYSCVASPV